MSKIKLDLSQFKHIHSKDGMTVLKHKDGHELTIANRALSPEGQAQLEQLAKGGRPNNPKLAESKKTPPEQTSYAMPPATPMAEGGSPDATFAYDHGLPCLNPSCKSNGKPHPNCRCYQRMAKGGMTKNVHYCAYGMPHDKSCEYYADGGMTPEEQQESNDDAKKSADDSYDQLHGTTPKSQQAPTLDPRTWWAEGGEIKPEAPKTEEPKAPPKENKLDYKQLRREYIDKNQTKFIKGGPRKMYASPEPGEPVSQDDSTPQKESEETIKDIRHGANMAGAAVSDAKDNVMRGLHALGKFIGDPTSVVGGYVNPPNTGAPGGMSQGPATPPEVASPQSPVPQIASPQSNQQPDSKDTQAPGITPEQNQTDQNQNEEMTGGMSQGPATPPQEAAPPPAANNPNAGPPTLQHPALASPQQYQQAVHDNIMDEGRAWSQDISDGHIQPETYQSLFEKKDTLGKIGTLFGLMLSGAGSGLSHQPNMLMDMMNKEIDRDLEAQKASSTNRQNYIKLAQAHELNKADILSKQAGVKFTNAQTKQLLQDADIKAKMFMQRSAVGDLAKKIDAMPDSPNKQQAINALGMMASKLDAVNSDVASQFAANKAMMHFMGQGYGGPGGETAFQQGMQSLTAGGQSDLAKDMQAHHFPGINQRTSSSIEGKDRDTVTAYQNVNDLFNRSLQFAQQPTPKNPSDLIKYKMAGQALHGKLIAAIKQAQQDGVYKPSEAHFILGQIGDSPASMFAAWNSVPKIKEYQLNAQNEYNNLLGKYGVTPQAIQGQVQAPGPQVQVGPKTKRPMYQDAQGQWRYKSQ